ncbi:DNA-directed DNA polymerase delta [Polyrhizophydium stewartii]|uniref:DNA polymerase n=1 Tax=Polyrhizophydium stewartii TaxID=2732419 RepID=A0ABR4N088_9FUNG
MSQESAAVKRPEPSQEAPRSQETLPSQSQRSKRARTLEVRSAFEEQLEHLHGHAPQAVDFRKSWQRPPLAPIDPSRDDIVFQQLDIDECIAKTPDSLVLNQHQVHEASQLRMFGLTEGGHSVVCHVHGFFPYFYVAAPEGFRPEHKASFTRVLDSATRANVNRQHSNNGPAIVDVHLVQRSSIYGFQRGLALFLRIDDGINVPGLGIVRIDLTFESNIPFPLRFMIDTKIQGASWVGLPAGSYKLRQPDERLSTCQIEIDANFQSIEAHQPEGDWSKIAPLRILSFDIECAGRKGVFPEAQVDPVIQIANMVTVQGESKPFIRNVFTLGTCAHIVGTHVLSHQTESEMLRAWSQFVREVDPDIIIGYNINGFDFPYLLDRAEALQLDDFALLGRISDSKTKAKDTRFSSKAYGTRDTKAINLEGRLQLDMLHIMQRDYKLRSYTLNSVCAHFLGEQKEDVHHSIITDLQNGNDETRRRLAVYCLKDAYLPQRLLDKLMCVINYIEMARVTGVPFNYILTRGQQIKVISQLYRKAATENLLIPALEVEGSEDQYEGATVIEPQKGFYQVPIATLDFTSLYPSIMMAHNLCYSTYIANNEMAARLGLVEDRDFKRTPNNDIFVKPSVRKGLLPTILEDLIAARKRAKNDLKKEEDPFKRAVLDGRQLALKACISANSVYGFTGATIGKLPLLAISSSVTAYGRVMIERTKQLVEERFKVANGYKHDAHVIYGDTDSVMVKFGVATVEEAMELGREAAGYVTSHFERPINLDFEKVYFPYLLINKKRYAGLYWTKPEKHDKLDAKGIETVRRDSCRLVSTVIETSLRKLLIDRDPKAAEEYVKRVIADLLQNKIDMSQLVISKALGKAEYAGKQAHNELAERMRKRDAGSAPALGDRVSYVIVKGTKDAAAYEKAEDPIYVLENNLPIDTKYYLENQLANPLMRIFEPVLGEKASSLLAGDHTRTISVAAPTSGGIMKFAVRTATCLGCKVPLKRSVCDNCSDRIPELHKKQLDAANELEIKFSRLWTECQRCQGSLHQDVICTSQDCPIFYMRKKVQKDMKEAVSQLERFDYNW